MTRPRSTAAAPGPNSATSPCQCSRPTIFFNVVLAVIGALKVFTTAWVATQGGPSYATWFFALHIYFQAFQYFRLGYGSALAWVLAAVLMFFTWVQVRYSRRWVHYEGG